MFNNKKHAKMKTFIYLVCCKAGNEIILATNSVITAKEDCIKLNSVFGTEDLYYIKEIQYIYGK